MADTNQTTSSRLFAAIREAQDGELRLADPHERAVEELVDLPEVLAIADFEAALPDPLSPGERPQAGEDLAGRRLLELDAAHAPAQLDRADPTLGSIRGFGAPDPLLERFSREVALVDALGGKARAWGG
ncbi:MAG: hypothetical protein HC927_03285, partial [Deltaproteobacteria bacterium]|nr:hypothetical protein [Deltaproteobacteria bacterium]